MSTDSRLAAEETRASAIENEIPSYRAVSRLAILSLLLGIMTVLTFASPWFALTGLAAIVVGALANRAIKRRNDVLTGTRLAQIGIAMGLIFSLSALTIGFVQGLKIKQSAAIFSREYAEVLKKGDLANSLWFRLDPEGRKHTDPQKYLLEIQSSSASNPDVIEMYLGGLQRLEQATGGKADIHYLQMESHGLDGITPYAFAAFEVHGKNAEGKEQESFALVELRSPPDSASYDWYVKEFVYPYELKSHALKAKPIDDGHNH